MNKIVKQLKIKCRDSNFASEIEKMEQYILMCDYDEAVDYIDGLLRTCTQ